MTLTLSLLILKLTLAAGITAWLAMVNFGNIVSFQGGAEAIGRLMNMAPFDEAPKIDSPLLARRVAKPGWHRLTYAVLLMLEFAVMALFANATVRLTLAVTDVSLVEAAVAHANLAFAGLLAFSFVMLMGGTWFAYYIRQEMHMITHLALIVVTLAGMVVCNLR
jgi:hypothetical protein